MPQAARRDSELLLFVLIVGGVLYGLLAYFLIPLTWRHYEHQKGLAGLTMVTRTGADIPGDPINVGAVGSKEDLLCAMNAAQWFPADPVTLRSSMEIAGSVLFDRPYRQAPVSPLYYEGRREDLAFEKPAGKSADRRHHVRFWKVLDHGEEERAVWLGAVTFDRGVGFSHDDGRITHHIARGIDAERDLLTADLTAAKVVVSIYEVTGIGPTFDGRNGGGDLYYTDGEIKISVLVEGCGQRAATTTVIANPPLVDLKNRAWSAVEGVLLPNPAEPASRSKGAQ
jgi:LssY C-terminus